MPSSSFSLEFIRVVPSKFPKSFDSSEEMAERRAIRHFLRTASEKEIVFLSFLGFSVFCGAITRHASVNTDKTAFCNKKINLSVYFPIIPNQRDFFAINDREQTSRRRTSVSCLGVNRIFKYNLSMALPCSDSPLLTATY
jgi:hypothetical protein